jgi:hypothetical protein
MVLKAARIVRAALSFSWSRGVRTVTGCCAAPSWKAEIISRSAHVSSVEGSSTTIPASALIVARVGGAAALLAAAAISASTLYHLGLMIGLAVRIAWLLPAAIDVYAACAIFTSYRLPPKHPARNAALHEARVALWLTIGCNALDHVLRLAATLIPSLARDVMLVVVACLPPLIVERLLHLQALLVTVDAADRPDVAMFVLDDFGAPRPDDRPVAGDQVLLNVNRRDEAAHLSSVGDRTQHRAATWHRLEAAALAEIGRPVYRDLAERSGRRPGERVFHQALAEAVTGLTQNGRLPPGTRPPSLSTAKRIRGLIEDVRSDEDLYEVDDAGGPGPEQPAI